MRVEDEKFLAALMLALGVVVVFQFDGFSGWFTPFLMPSLFCLMVFSLLPYISYTKETFTKLHPAIIPLVAIQQLGLPSLAALCGTMMNADPQILFFIMVTLTSGSLFASPTLIHLMGLDQKLAVQSVIISTLFAPISIYIGFSILNDSHFNFNISSFLLRLFLLLILPLAIFFAIRFLARGWSETVVEKSTKVGRWGSVLSLIIFCFALEAPVVEALKQEGNLVLYYFLVSLTTTIVVALTLRLALTYLGYHTAMTASVLGSFRNIGLTFGLVGFSGDPHLAVYVGASQIPMFFAPLLFEFTFGRDVRSRKNTSPSKEPTPHLDRMEYPMSETSKPTSANTYTKAAVATSTTSVAVSSGAVVGGNTMSAEVATDYVEHVEKNEQLVEQAQTEPVGEDARVLMERLEDHYQAEPEAEKATGWWTGARFTIATLVLFVVGMIGIWQGNKYFAPMLFDQKMIAEVAQSHVDGKNYGVFDLNINIRDLRNETIKRMKKTPDVGILGASHWQEAHVDSISSANVYNSHIHRDYYEDMMAMVEIYERHDRLPPELIITIRDKLLTPVKDRTDFLWLPGIKYYRAFAERVGFTPHSKLETLPVQTWRELANFSLLKTHGMRHLTAPIMPHATDKRNFETLDTLLPDGSILWSGEHKRLFSQEYARKEALSFAEASKNSPPKIDPKGIEHMEFLFEYLKKKGVRVTLAHPQFNPIFWNEVQGTEYMVGLKKIQDQTKDWAKKYGFGMIGGFAPEDVGCKAIQYIDAEHGDPACLAMLMSQYRFRNNEFDLRGALN